MPVLQWSSQYELGIKEIDEQHHSLVNIINELLDSFNQDAELEVTKKVLDELEDYANLHFATEEKYFDKFQFEGTEEHKAEHRKFKEELVTLKNDLQMGKTTVPEATLHLLVSWFTDHEQDFDKKYVPCFHEHGLY